TWVPTKKVGQETFRFPLRVFPVHRPSHANKKLFNLIKKPDMAPANDAARRIAVCDDKQGFIRRIEANEVERARPPGETDLTAEIRAGPSEDRRRRRRQWLGRESRRSGKSKGTSRCQEKLVMH